MNVTSEFDGFLELGGEANRGALDTRTQAFHLFWHQCAVSLQRLVRLQEEEVG